MKRLYRSEKDRILAGVLGGISEYFKIDPTLIRLLFVAIVLFTGGTLLLIYLIAIFVIPNEGEM
ncbi:PspC domain-containing protein [Oceanobacillus halotolerans]|uniref:PspC domain-containing protein n=1 Tax=Oceanobacillus halotolerans TaxID=2663380 RepID=UPI0013DB057E|nr:PspC domain-containing protein [Oceanobacillus halotolerans]